MDTQTSRPDPTNRFLTPLFRLGTPVGYLTRITWSGDGRTLLCGDGVGRLVRWYLEQGLLDGYRLETLRGQCGSINALAWGGDARDSAESWFASAGDDGSVVVWRSDGTRIGEPVIGLDEWVVAACAQPGGRFLAASSPPVGPLPLTGSADTPAFPGGGIWIGEMKSGRGSETEPFGWGDWIKGAPPTTALCWLEIDGRRELVAGGGENGDLIVRYRDTGSGTWGATRVARVGEASAGGGADRPAVTSLVPVGQSTVACGLMNGTVEIWDVVSGERTACLGSVKGTPLWRLSVSADLRYLAGVAENGIAGVWRRGDTGGFRPFVTLPAPPGGGGYQDVAFHPHGVSPAEGEGAVTVLAATTGRYVLLWALAAPEGGGGSSTGEEALSFRAHAESETEEAEEEAGAEDDRDLIQWAGGETSRSLALAFVDIVDSTANSLEYGGERWGEAREAHFTAARRVARRHGGRVVKTLGDGEMVVFKLTAEALDFALALGDSPGDPLVTVRIGLHFGLMEVQADDVQGNNVNYGARVESAGKSALGNRLRISGHFKANLEGDLAVRHRELRWEPYEAPMKGIGRETVWALDSTPVNKVEAWLAGLGGDSADGIYLVSLSFVPVGDGVACDEEASGRFKRWMEERVESLGGSVAREKSGGFRLLFSQGEQALAFSREAIKRSEGGLKTVVIDREATVGDSSAVEEPLIRRASFYEKQLSAPTLLLAPKCLTWVESQRPSGFESEGWNERLLPWPDDPGSEVPVLEKPLTG